MADLHKPPTVLDYERPPRRMGGTARRVARLGILLGAIGSVLLLAFTLIDVAPPRRTVSPRLLCAARLRLIGQGLLLYANDNAGTLPPNLSLLIEHAEIRPEVFVCPESTDTRAQGPNTKAILADFAKPGHCSYQYFGAGLREPLKPDVILACEPLAHHHKKGINILYGDGHVDWESAPYATYILGRLAAGHNPPRPPPTQPSTQRAR